MSNRNRQEIAEKQAKLAELRRAREERKALLAQAESKAVEPVSTARKDVNDLVDSLLSSTRPSSPYPPGSSRHTPTPNNAIPRSATPPLSVPGTPGGRISRMSNDGSSTGPIASTSNALTHAIGDRDEGDVAGQDFVDHSAELYELPAKIKSPPVTYSKAIQTSSMSMSTSTSDLEEDNTISRRKGGKEVGRETEDEMRARLLREMNADRIKADEDSRGQADTDRRRAVGELSHDQRTAIYTAPDFSAFIEESTKIVQRALNDSYDYIKDYTIGTKGDYDDGEGQKTKLFCVFSDDRWTEGRSVTDLDWSSKFPELTAAAYNKNPSAPNDPDGIVAIWNQHLQERPEFIFHSPSDVVSVTFSPFHPTLVFGGTYSGQVLLWDTRAKHMPVLKTPLSASGHTYPIYAMKMIGTQNANNLITSSTDGLVCSWLADMLAQPQDALQLTVSSHNKTDEVSITALDFPNSDTVNFWIGTEEGSVYQANRFDRASSKAGLNADEVYRDHAGPVTGLHCHPGNGSIDFSDLILTSSVDWTIKLWKAKSGQKITGSSGSHAQLPQPKAIHSFEEANDYVFDVNWHPSHPSIFASADGSGKLDIWDINQDIEVPVSSTVVSAKALNKLAWSRAPGARKVAVGSSDGKVYVYEVAEKLVTPRESEWTEMQKTIQGLLAHPSNISSMGTPEAPTTTGSRYRSSLI